MSTPTPAFEELEAWDEAKGLPTRANCDPNNPRTALLWCFVAPPMVVGAPLPFPIRYYEHVSYRLWLCGIRPTEEPEIEYQPPMDGMMNARTAAGQWVPVGTPWQPQIDPAAVEFVKATIPQADRDRLRDALLQAYSDGGGEGAPGSVTVTDIAEKLRVNPDRLLAVLATIGIADTADSVLNPAVTEQLTEMLGDPS